MARDSYEGRHRVSRKAKLTTGGLGLAVLTVGALAVFTTTGSPPQASADNPDLSQFVDITTVEPNVNEPEAQQDASTGTFTVDCGRNENGHFNPDNFIAQPGVRNGAQHLHDYVGNLSTDADSNNQSLQAAGTTCRNGDKSAYFWPVVRIDTEGDSEEEQQQDSAEEAQAEQAGRSGNQNQDGRQAGPGDRNAGQNDGQGDGQGQGDQAQNDGQDQNGGQNEQGGQDQQGDQGQQGDQNGGQDQQGAQNQQGGQGDQNQQGDQNGGQQNDGQNGDQQGGQGQNDGQNQNQGQDNGQNQDGQGQNGDQGGDQAELPAQDENGELPGNEGEIQRPAVVDITFRGSPVTEVEAMPKFLRVLYGDAKVSTNGPGNARESWTCSGFEDQVRIDKYVICPEGSDVMRVHDFPSCWDGENIDSANHRDHIVYPNENGQCEDGFTAVPQLRISLTYEIPRSVQLAGQYKVDAFPEEDHNPFSDHDDFANVMSNAIMNRVVDCINSGRTCTE